MRRLRERLSYANVTSSLALFVALGGTTAWAVDGPLAGQNTVGSEDIINNEVKSADIGDGKVFKVDLADNQITGQKIKDHTLTGSDLAQNLILSEALSNTKGFVSLEGDDGLAAPQGQVTAGAIKNGVYSRATISPSYSKLNELEASGALHLNSPVSDPLDLEMTDPGLIFDQATTVPTLHGAQPFLYMRRSGTDGPFQLVLLWPNGERDILATYDTAPT